MAISSLDGVGAAYSDRAAEPVRRASHEEDRGVPIVAEPGHDSPVDRRPDVVRPPESSSDADSRGSPREPELSYSPRSPADLALDVARSDAAIDRLREAHSAAASRRSLMAPD